MAASDPTGASAASLTTRADAGEGKAGVVSLWLQAIDLASKEEAEWRGRAENVVRLYRGERDKATGGTARRRFNILYSNIETLGPAVYNSLPIPDVRRRFNEADPVSKAAALVIERNLTFSMEAQAFDGTLQRAVKDALLVGRSVARVKYEPTFGPSGDYEPVEAAPDDEAAEGAVVTETTRSETVDWTDFRRGPARCWYDVPWIAFRHYLTREELTRLSPQIGPRIELDARVPGMDEKDDKSGPPPDLFRRATVWEVWDKEKREVVFVAKAWPDAPVKVVPDPLGLEGFYPIPEPIYAMQSPGDLTPVEPYRLYKDLADELDIITRRIAALTSAMKWRGAVIDPNLGDFMSKFADLKDGEITPIENPAQMLNGGGGLDKAFWFMPIEQCATVLAQLYASREQVKQTIYEVTGISDIARGATKAGETATAQQIKSQWGSLRIQHLQSEVARFARDLLRLEAEIMAEKFAPDTLFAVSGVTLPSEQEVMAQVQQQMQGQPVGPAEMQKLAETPTQESVMRLLRDDATRRFRIDIETDSTIRADVQRAQENIGQFVQGFGAFIQAVGPAVQTGAMPMPVAAEMIKSFARVFKLGRSVEDALEQMPTEQPPQADPAAAAAKAEEVKQQAETQRQQMKLQAEGQAQQADMQAKAAEVQMQGQMEQAKLAQQAQDAQLQAQLAVQGKQMELEAQLQIEQARIAFEREKFGIEVALREREMEQNATIQREKISADAEAKREATATSYAAKAEATEAARERAGAAS